MQNSKAWFTRKFIFFMLLVLFLFIGYYFNRWQTPTIKWNLSPNNNQTSITNQKLIEILIFLTGLPFKEKKYFSQNGEDGVTEALLDKIGGPKYKYYVEFGVESGRECNTRFLRERGWQGLLMDNNHNNSAINLHKEYITYANIVSLFEKHSVPKQFDLLSIDTNMKDYWILRALLEAGYRPRIIISEMNHRIPPSLALTVPKDLPDVEWDIKSGFTQHSLAAAWKLSREFHYSMIYCEKSLVNYFSVIDGSDGFGEGFRLSDYLSVFDLYHPRDGKMLTLKEIDPLERKWTEV